MHGVRTPPRNKFGHKRIHQPSHGQICFPTMETAVFIFQCMISQFDIKVFHFSVSFFFFIYYFWSHMDFDAIGA